MRSFLWRFGCGLLLTCAATSFAQTTEAEKSERKASVLASQASRDSAGVVSAHVGVWSSDNGESAQGELTLRGLPEGSLPIPNISDLGDAEWQFDGQRVTGVLTRDGNKVGVFEGRASPAGITGMFRMLDGREWEWSWTDSNPNPSIADDGAEAEQVGDTE